MPEDQAVVEAPSSPADAGGPLDALDDAQGAGNPSSDDSSETDDGTTGGESPQVTEGQTEDTPAEEAPDDSPKTETEVLREQVLALEAEKKTFQETLDKAVAGHRALQSQYDQRESELAPLLEQQVRELNGLIANDEYWEGRIGEIGMTPAMAERDAAIAKKVIIEERGRAEQQRLAARDQEQMASMKQKFLDAGKTEAEFQQFVDQRNGLASYTYADAHALVDSILAGEHAHKVDAKAEETRARETEENLRRKAANQTAKEGAPASPSKSVPGTPGAALEAMATVKAQMDAQNELL
ncbi:MAG: hypothetical protein ACE5FA_05530 [Dehalococcoidia bacterium]